MHRIGVRDVRRRLRGVSGVLAVALSATIVCCTGGPTAAAASRVPARVLGSACPGLGTFVGPDEARQAAKDVAYQPPVSPTLTRYAMALASESARATPKVPPPQFVAVDSEPTPKLAETQQAATACGYTGKVRSVVISVPLPAVEADPRLQVDVVDKQLRGSAAIGVGVAFDRYGDLHIVYVGGTINDNDGSDPFATFAENKPANPEPHPTGFMVLLSVGPICTTHPRSCGYDHPAHAQIGVFNGIHKVAHGVTNAKGMVSILVPKPGRYTITSSFRDRGRLYHTKSSGFPALRGKMLPVELTACPPGDRC